MSDRTSRMRLSIRAASVACLVLAGLGTVMASPAGAVANGVPVPEGQYRFAVKLTMTDIPRTDGTHYNSACSAALIAPEWIITAGHCFHAAARNRVNGPVPYPTTATVGRADLTDTTGYVVNVVADYQSPTNDVAVARLDRPIRGIQPLRLPEIAPRIGEILRIAGWGSLTDVNPAPATHLQTGQFKVVEITDPVVGVVGYAPQPDTSACTYDSGAPYFAERRVGRAVLVSVESDGPACPHSQVETTSRVDTIVPWIRDTIR